MQRPDFLTTGDRIMIVSPSGKVDPGYVEGAMQTFREWGFDPVAGEFALSECGRFAGDDKSRLYDLQEVLCDDKVKAIFCSRGGYGAIRLLDEISSEWISDRPKWLIGYSDITALHALFRREGVMSLHAPMAKHLTVDKEDEASHALRNFLLGNQSGYGVDGHPLNHPGWAEGVLFGGNLSVLFGLRGTLYDQIKPGDILFIEDIAERPYHIERMMYNLRMGGILENLSGLIVGRFTDYEEDLSMGRTLYETISEMTRSYGYPVCFGFPVGHVSRNLPMPEGAKTRLSVEKDRVELKFCF